MFTRADGSSYDYVFNCGGDNRFSQDDEIYKQRSLQLSTTAAKEAAKRGVKCWVELSTGAVYKAEREPRKETDKLKPWTRVAKYKLEAEEELQKIPGCVAAAGGDGVAAAAVVVGGGSGGGWWRGELWLTLQAEPRDPAARKRLRAVLLESHRHDAVHGARVRVHG